MARVGVLTLDQKLIQALAYFGSYWLFVALYKLLALTLLVYFLVSPESRFQDITEAYSSNELNIVAFGAFLYLFTVRKLNPLTSLTTHEIFTAHRFEKRFAPGFVHGATVAVALTIAFLFTGFYIYLGPLFRLEDAPLNLLSVLTRAFLLFAFVYCEEFIFRNRILNTLHAKFPLPLAILLTSVGYCAIKIIQFDLGVMHLATLFLASVALSLRSVVGGDFTRGAGYWAGLLIVSHALLSLPVFGSEFQGILLIKYEGLGESGEPYRLLSGGVAGPLSSITLQLVFAIDILQNIVKNRRILLH